MQNKDKDCACFNDLFGTNGHLLKQSQKLKNLLKVQQFAIPNDGANESRALLLLQSAGLIKLKAGFDPVKSTPADITENAKAIVIKPIQMATAVRVKDEVDAILLGNTLALEGGFERS